MKKLLLTLALGFMLLFMSAQTPLTTAVDFTATDTHGNTINLFNILNGGQYVFIDFFFIN